MLIPCGKRLLRSRVNVARDVMLKITLSALCSWESHTINLSVSVVALGNHKIVVLVPLRKELHASNSRKLISLFLRQQQLHLGAYCAVVLNS